MADPVARTPLNERYALLNLIGTGGMAAVYRAIDLTNGARVAVKVLNRTLLSKNPKEADRNVRRFRREGEILKILAGSRYVVEYIEHGSSAEGDEFIAMELLEGEQLRFHVGRGRAVMGLRTFAFYARHLVRGLMDVHARGVIHRDISPDNIVIVKTPEGLPWPKFVDFGIGKALDGRVEELTQIHTIMGKPQYFSPEQAWGSELTAQSDVYALAVVLYEMLTGHVPIEVHSVAELRRIQRDAPTPLRSHREGARLHEEVQTLIMRCLEKRPEDRPRLADLLAALERFSDRLDAGEEFTAPGGSIAPDESTGPVAAVDANPAQSTGQSGVLEAGAHIGRFVVKDRIARGGMGMVYLAWDPVLHRDVALKIATRVEGEKARRSLLREARASSQLRSENIVTIYDAGSEGDTPYIAMEYVEGKTLAQIIDEEGPLGGDRFWQLARGILDGLVDAHEASPPVIHRDLKPANILCAGNVAKIADFGIATGQHLNLMANESSSSGATGIEGSVFTMSPEQANNKPADHRSDIYSLGCLLYMMVTGRAPFQGNQIAILYQHVTRTPERPTEVNPRLAPPELDAVILKCLEKDPANRFQSAREVRDRLAPLFAERTARSWHRSPVLMASIGALVIVAAAIAFAVLSKKTGADARPIIRSAIDGVPVIGGKPQGAHVTRARYVDVEVTRSTVGDVRVRVEPSGGEPPYVHTAAITRAGEPTPVRVALPDPGAREPARLTVRIDCPDDPAHESVEFELLQDLVSPRVSFRAYSNKVAARTTPIRVVRLRDLWADIADPGGIDEVGTPAHVTRALDSTSHGTAFTRVALEGGPVGTWKATVHAVDRAGNTTNVPPQLVEVAPIDFVVSTPANTAVGSRSLRIAGTARLRDPSHKIAGLNENDLNLGNGAFKAYLAIGPVSLVEMARTDSGYEATLELPSDTPSEVDVDVYVVFEGEHIKVSQHRFDFVPPLIVAKSGGVVVRSSETYSDMPTLYVDTLSAGTSAVTCTIEDGPRGIAGARVDVQVGNASPQSVAIDAAGRFSLPPLEGEESVVRVTGTDAAGNAASAEFLVVRTGLQVTAVRVGGVEPDAEGCVFVKSDRVPIQVFAVGVLPTDGAFAIVLGDGAFKGDVVKLERVQKDTITFEAPEVRLSPEGAGVVVRGLRIAFGPTAATARAPGRDLSIVCDREPPSISVTSEEGGEEMRGSRVVGRFPRLFVKVADNVALASDRPETIVSWTRDDRSAPDIVVERAAGEAAVSKWGATEASFVIERPPPWPYTHRFDIVVVARDRAGRETRRTFDIQVEPSGVAVSSIADHAGADRTDFKRFGVSPETPLVLNRSDVVVTVTPPRPPAGACTIVARAFPEVGVPEPPRRFSLDPGDRGTSVELVVPLSKGNDGSLVTRGRLELLVEEAGTTQQEELASVYYLLDREPPTYEIMHRTAVLEHAEQQDWIKVASLSSVKVVVRDGRGSGFDDAAIDADLLPAMHFEHRSADRIVFSLRDDDTFRVGQPRERTIPVRDVAGNVTHVRLQLVRSKELLDVTRVLNAAGAEPLRREDLVIVKEAKLDVTVQSDAVEYEGVQWVVKRGEVVIGRGFAAIDRGAAVATAEISWPAAENAEAYAVEFFPQGPSGVASEAFHRFRVLVDTSPPQIQVRVRDRFVAKAGAAAAASFDDLRVDITDNGSGVATEGVVIEAGTGGDIGGTLQLAVDGELRRVVPDAPPPPGRYSVTISAEDRLGNESKKVVDLTIAPDLVPWQTLRPASRMTTQPTTRPNGPVADQAAREKDELRTGIKFVPVWESADRNGPPRFFMSQTEVTNEQFLRFAEALLKDQVPPELRWRADQGVLRKRIEAMRHRFDDFKRDPSLPVVEVEPEVAFAFAAWAGGRLPSRDEWINAAGRYLLKDARYPVYVDRGTPRSDEFWMRDPTFANFQRGKREAKRVPVTDLLRTQASAPFGIVGFAGNVAEWVTETPRDRRVVGTMGGSFKYPYTNEVHSARFDAVPSNSAADAGVRVLWPAGLGKIP